MAGAQAIAIDRPGVNTNDIAAGVGITPDAAIGNWAPCGASHCIRHEALLLTAA